MSEPVQAYTACQFVMLYNIRGKIIPKLGIKTDTSSPELGGLQIWDFTQLEQRS